MRRVAEVFALVPWAGLAAAIFFALAGESSADVGLAAAAGQGRAAVGPGVPAESGWSRSSSSFDGGVHEMLSDGWGRSRPSTPPPPGPPPESPDLLPSVSLDGAFLNLSVLGLGLWAWAAVIKNRTIRNVGAALLLIGYILYSVA